MKNLIITFISVLCLVTATHGQTIKSLGYNTTNGRVVVATNLVYTNAFSFSTNTVAAQVRTNLGLGAAWLTNTNTANFRTAIGLGVSSGVALGSLTVGGTLYAGNPDEGVATKINGSSIAFREYGNLILDAEEQNFRYGNTNVLFSWTTDSLTFHKPIVLSQNFVIRDPVEDVAVITFQADNPVVLNAQYWNNTDVRTALGLSLPALSNTSNVTMMRALAGSTNTNHPFSGTVSVVGTNSTNTLIFSNGILREVQ